MTPETLTPRERVHRIIRLHPEEAAALGLRVPGIEPSIDMPIRRAAPVETPRPSIARQVVAGAVAGVVICGPIWLALWMAP